MDFVVISVVILGNCCVFEPNPLKVDKLGYVGFS
jgi:hypothetical protein